MTTALPSSLLPRRLRAGDLQLDAMETHIDGDVERRFLLTRAEAAVARDADGRLRSTLRQTGRDEGDLLAVGIGDQDARALQAPLGEIEVALLVNRHSVEAVLLAEVDQRSLCAADEAVVAEREG